MVNKLDDEGIISKLPFIEELALTKDGKFCRCEEITCEDCVFYTQFFPDSQKSCLENLYLWIKKEYANETVINERLKKELKQIIVEYNRLKEQFNKKLENTIELKSPAPCKIGEKVFYIQDGEIYEGTILYIEINYKNEVGAVGIDVPILDSGPFCPGNFYIESSDFRKKLFFSNEHHLAKEEIENFKKRFKKSE